VAHRRLLLLLLALSPGCHRWSSDGSAAAGLKTLNSAQQDFQAHDRDEDGVKNFWVRDVAGLYGFDPGKGPIKLTDISLAQADRTLGKGRYASVPKEAPYVESYSYAALKRYRESGKSVAYDDGTGRNPSHFGIVAFPEEYSESSKLTFILNEKNTLYSKDTRGRPPEEFPEDPLKEGWKPLSP
jgi:hypothetical protein